MEGKEDVTFLTVSFVRGSNCISPYQLVSESARCLWKSRNDPFQVLHNGHVTHLTGFILTWH
jgi:hypothetical protein